MRNLLLAVVFMFTALSVSAQEKNFIDQNYIEITGRADMEVAPDEIFLTITINEKDNRGRVSVEQQEADMFRRLQALGIDLEKDLTVQDMSTDLRTFLLRRNTIMTSKSYQLKINSTAMLSKVFQALGEAGISDASIARTSISNIKEIQQTVRVNAIKSAQQTATVLAEAVGRKAGEAIFIQDYGYSPRYYGNVARAKSITMDAEGGAPAPELEFEKIRVEISVLVRFTLK